MLWIIKLLSFIININGYLSCFNNVAQKQVDATNFHYFYFKKFSSI